METLISNKSSEFHHAVAEGIKNRRSVRAYEDRGIEPAKIQSLFEAARWAPSSSNEQPWMYVYATKEQPDLWQKLFDTLNEGNRLWAKNAPLLILSLTKKNLKRNGQPNGFALYDLGAANSFLALQAVDLGLQVRQMGGYSKDKAKETLAIPDDYAFGPMIAAGYPGKTEDLHETLQERERAQRERFLQHEFTMNKTF